MTRRILGVAVLTVVLAGISASAQADTIRVQSTTDTVDSGLVDGLIRGAYFQAQPGDTLDYVGVGTGAALTNARAGLADVVITHAPSLEAQFVTDGYSFEPLGRAIFSSDYVIIGPTSDPAHVLANHPHDAVGALEDIAAAGELATPTADFLSRADNSGTNVQEQKMWGLTTTVTKSPASNGGTDATRFEPGTGGPTANVYPAWYHRVVAGQAANVNRAEACPTATFPSGNCYTITDRGTFNRLVNAGTVPNLKIVSDKNTPGVRGGENLLVNPFSAYIVNPAATFPPMSPTPNVAAATRFVDFLTSPSFQAAVDNFPSTTDPAFRGDAFAKITLSPALPPTATAGSTVAIHATLTNKLPGAGPIDGMAVQLQQSTDAGATYTNVGAPVNTSPTGAVSFSPTITATTRFRFSMPSFQTTSSSSLTSPNTTLSPNSQDIGIVSLPGSTPPPPPPPPPPKDTKAPTLSKVVLTARKISLTTSEPAKIKITIAKRVKHGHHFVYKTIKTVTLTATKAGKLSRTLSRLSRGTYRVKLRATDAAGNVRNKTVHPHVS